MYAHIDTYLLFSPFSMEHLFVRKSTLQSQVEHLVEPLKDVAAQRRFTVKLKRGLYNAKPWFGWDDEQRGAAAELYQAVELQKCQLQYGLSCLLESNFCDWGVQFTVQSYIAPKGRLRKMSDVEAKVGSRMASMALPLRWSTKFPAGLSLTSPKIPAMKFTTAELSPYKNFFFFLGYDTF